MRASAARPCAFAIKAAFADPDAPSFVFTRQKTMYCGREIAAGDTIFLFASETQGGSGLFGRGRVSQAEDVERIVGVARQTPRVSIAVEKTAVATVPLGREQLRLFRLSRKDRAEAELDFKLYRQATNKIVGLSDQAMAFLEGLVLKNRSRGE